MPKFRKKNIPRILDTAWKYCNLCGSKHEINSGITCTECHSVSICGACNFNGGENIFSFYYNQPLCQLCKSKHK